MIAFDVSLNLDSKLVERANSASALGNAGDIIERSYENILDELYELITDPQQRSMHFNNVKQLAYEALSATINSPNPFRTGRARTNKKKNSIGADKIAKANSALNQYVPALKNQMNKEKSKQRNNSVQMSSRAEAVQKALANDLLSFVYDGKKYSRKSKRSKTFTLDE
jgi:hypothetical protein